MRRSSRSLTVYLRLLRRDLRRNARQLVRTKRRRGQLTIVLTRPRFGASRRYLQQWRVGWSIRRFANGTFASIALLVVGTLGMAYGLVHLSALQVTPTVSAESAPPPAQTEAPPQPLSMPRALPSRLAIPDIGVDTSLIQLGMNEDKSMETPEGYDVAGWYKYSPTPGEIGPSVIVGHVDSYQGAAVFYRLRELQPGQRLSVTREDGSAAQFEVTRLAQFEQDNFPSDAVYGNTPDAELRVITCGGPFDRVNVRYTQNTVVYAKLIAANLPKQR